MIGSAISECANTDAILLERKSIDIKFQDVSYRIPQGRNAPKTILKNLNGLFKSGQLTAILGPSGAGKSTLLNVLAGYKYHGFSGTIYINGKVRNMKEFRRMSRYIMQEDLLQKWLTAEELMMVAANLKLSNKTSTEKKKETVLEILELLRLTNAKDTLTDKLSGGERKRLSIAIELVNNPPILFLDEPTTGLDDLASVQCIALLKSLSDGGRTVICSIHTPSAKLFAQFDQAYVLSDGICVYQGYGPNLVNYLENIGLICPTHYNPADFIIEVCSGEYGNFTDKLASMANTQFMSACETSYEHGIIYDDISEFSCNRNHEVPILFQFKTILFRMWKQMIRDTNHMLLKLTLHIVLGIFVGYVFYDIANDAGRTIYNFGFFYCCLMFFLYIPLMPILLYFPSEVQLTKREYLNRWYSLKAYFTAMTVSTMPTTILMSILFLGPVYTISGQPLEAGRFVCFYILCVLTAFISESFGLIVSSFLGIVNSMFLAPACSVPFMLLAVYGMGFGHVGIPIVMKVLMHLSYLRYSLEGILNSVMRNRGPIPCHVEEDKLCLAFSDTNVFLEMMGFEERNVWMDVGVGKSTFINILGNYLTYNSLDEAAAANLLYSVPTKFSMIDDDLTEHEIIIGSSSNEVTVAGASSTQNPQTYLFNLKDHNAKLRVIDTPGIGDTRGMQYDEWNTEKLLTFISELDYLNAICVMLKPNNSRFSVLFDYCMKQILLRLDKKVKNNIVFLFTNARSSFYTPGDTFVPLRHMLQQVEVGSLKTKIPLNSNNIFCIDNESFRYLAARSSGLQFSEEVTQEYRTSWNRSFDAIKKMMQYCANLPPVPMQGIVSINESRRIIMRLAKPVVDLMVLYEKAVVRITDHEEELQENKDNIVELKKRLYVPVMETYLKEKHVVIDTHTGHSFGIGIGLSAKPPFLDKLDIDYKYNDTNTSHVEEKFASREKIVRDPEIDNLLKKETDLAKILKKEIEKLEAQSEEYQNEAKEVLTIVSKFIVFLRENAMVSDRDPFQEYLENIIEEETVGGGDEQLILRLQRLLNRYKVKKRVTSAVFPEDIRDGMHDLLRLKNSGTTFKQLMNKKYVFNDQLQITQ
ncbi:hypothetical protein Trydic_g7361 [Trypoxylus dichotomus]